MYPGEFTEFIGLLDPDSDPGFFLNLVQYSRPLVLTKKLKLYDLIPKIQLPALQEFFPLLQRTKCFGFQDPDPVAQLNPYVSCRLKFFCQKNGLEHLAKIRLIAMSNISAHYRQLEK